MTSRPAKTAIFLTERYLDRLDVEAVPGREEVRLVAIVCETARARFPRDKERFFSAIHTVPPAPPRLGLVPELHEERTRELVEQELARVPSPAHVGIVCACEGNVLLAARLRDAFGIPGVGSQQATLFRDKVAMKTHLQARGIWVPRHARIDARVLDGGVAAAFARLAAELGAPFILKPVQEAGAFGVFKIAAARDLEGCMTWLDSIAYEAEELIEGKLFHVDSLVQDGRTVFAECAELTWPALDYLAGRPVGSLPLPDTDPLRARLLGFAGRVLVALGAASGATHMEVFVTPQGELVFLEVGGRIPGALIVPMYERAYGINMFSMDVLIQLGVPIACQRRVHTHCCWVIFPGSSGRVASVVAPRVESEHQLEWSVKPGDRLAARSSMIDKVATVMAWNRDYTVLRRDFERLRDHAAVTLDGG